MESDSTTVLSRSPNSVNLSDNVSSSSHVNGNTVNGSTLLVNVTAEQLQRQLLLQQQQQLHQQQQLNMLLQQQHPSQQQQHLQVLQQLQLPNQLQQLQQQKLAGFARQLQQAEPILSQEDGYGPRTAYSDRITGMEPKEDDSIQCVDLMKQLHHSTAQSSSHDDNDNSGMMINQHNALISDSLPSMTRQEVLNAIKSPAMINNSPLLSSANGNAHGVHLSPTSQQYKPDAPGPLNPGGFNQPVGKSETNNASASSYSNTYATLTPLQPLPPISTVSDKFSTLPGNSLGNFVLMQNSSGNLYAAYRLEREPDQQQQQHSNNVGVEVGGMKTKVELGAGLENNATYGPLSSNLLMNSNITYNSSSGSSQEQLQQLEQQKLHLEQRNLSSLLQQFSNQSEAVNSSTMVKCEEQLLPTSFNLSTTALTASYANELMLQQLQQQQQLKQLSNHHQQLLKSDHLDQRQQLHGSPSSSTSVHNAALQRCTASPMHDQPTSSTDMHDGSLAGGGAGGELEEMNTREIAIRVSNELKKYSIPQAVFAQRVLGRSQGTLSDLLRNPKPWSKLKSGRETFRRMWKWLQEPEYHRMSSLRMAGGSVAGGGGGSAVGGGSVGGVVGGSVGVGGNMSGVVGGSMGVVGGASSSYSMSPDISLTIKQSSPNPSVTAAAAVVAGMKRGRDLCRDGMLGGGSSLVGSSGMGSTAKKPRMVFTEIQRRTLVAIFKEIKRPSKEIQATIAEQLGLKVSTVVNFFMNARRRSVDKYTEDVPAGAVGGGEVMGGGDVVNSTVSSSGSGGGLDEVMGLGHQ